MKIEATRAKMLAVCCMHIAIANNMSSMGLVTKAINAVKKTNEKGFFTCGNCTKCHAPGRYNYPAKDSEGVYPPVYSEYTEGSQSLRMLMCVWGRGEMSAHFM